jgi:hypothetical protein
MDYPIYLDELNKEFLLNRAKLEIKHDEAHKI